MVSTRPDSKVLKKDDIDVNELLKEPMQPFEKFHNLTKIKKYKKEINRSEWPTEWIKIFYKGYARLPETILPKPVLEQKVLSEFLEKRESRREFSQVLTTERISNLLYFSAGIKDNRTGARFYPSAGARYPLEVYFISMNSEIPQGLYHYYVKNNSLELVGEFNSDVVVESFKGQEWVYKASALLIITGVFIRNTTKYGNRGYRHVLTEAGCMLQNIYLISASQNIACCAIGGYVDDKLNNYLDIDGFSETVLEVVALG